MKSLYTKVLIGFIVSACIIYLHVSGILHYLTLDYIKLQRLWLQEFVTHHYGLSVIFFISLYILVITFALPVAAVLTVAGGFLFGGFIGAIYTNIGATIGAICSFLIIRYLAGNDIQEKYHHQVQPFNDNLRKYGSTYLLIVRFIGLIPFFLINIIASLTTISLWTFTWTTSVGIFPGSFVYSYAGHNIMNLSSLSDIISWHNAVLMLMLTLFAIVPLMVTKIIGKKA